MVTTDFAPHKNNEIRDFDSFKQLDPLAQLYFFRVLDLLVDLVHTLSHSFISKPQLYRDLEQDEADILGKFFTQYGTEPKFLNPNQRNHIFDAIFGYPGGHEGNDCDSFPVLRDSLLDACARYAANIRKGDNIDALTAEVDTALIPFRNYLLGLQGGAVVWGLDRLTDVTTAAYRILQNDTVAIANGVSKAPRSPWPIVPDPNGSIEVEEISKKHILRGCFGLIRQVALRGARAIENVIECNGQVTDELIINCNIWHSALMNAKKACRSAGLHYICGH